MENEKSTNLFPDQILDKTQLQRFLGSLNYISDFYQNLRQQCKPLFDRLQTNRPPWTLVLTSVVQEIKKYVKTLPCLGIPSVNSFKIAQTNASNIGYGGILLQRVSPTSPKQIVYFHSGIWTPTQLNYNTIRKEILSIVLCISKFQRTQNSIPDFLTREFLQSPNHNVGEKDTATPTPKTP
ncbi:hypothetical protein RGQ29_017529 [Quercus rubra]|uniref:Reverse transcriptase/retrotransposon-derived protein RNase H-like domain-containing protein n=1 Tax=Quercus rubra TaxID=3512 RepID=A0AAN7J0W0_QUERU|nr:hypothetical protein RGQ29_017529 [Quercus rubra]